MTRRARVHSVVACAALLWGAAAGFCPSAFAQASATGPAWSQLSPAQQRALEPLRGDWDGLDAARKQKWLEVASRFDRMSPQRQERVRERMTEWSRMSPTQRTEARVNFQQSKRVPAEDRQARWEAYQALSPEERAALAARATQPPQRAPDPATAPAQSLRRAPVDAQAPKSNVVPPASGRLRAPTPVSPSVVQGNPGATTSLVTMPPRTPAHQTPGEPKIAATPKLVDRTTLLPKAGPQAAGTPPAAPRAPRQEPPAGGGSGGGSGGR